MIRWADRGSEIFAWGRGRPQNIDYFGKPGVTWPPRTNLRFAPRLLPAGCAFASKGPAAFPTATQTPVAGLLGVLSSSAAFLLMSVRLQTADESPKSISKSYEVGLVRDLPLPDLRLEQMARVSTLATRAVLAAATDQISEQGEVVTLFSAASAVVRISETFGASVEAAVRLREDQHIAIADHTSEIDTIIAAGYGFGPAARATELLELESPIGRYPETARIDDVLFERAYLTVARLPDDALPGGEAAAVDVRVEHRRGRQAKLRTETAICRLFEAPPKTIAETRRRLGLLRAEDTERVAAELLSYTLGAVFGRWDARLALHPEWAPQLTDPFAALPRCPLGQLVDADGLPATPNRIASSAWLARRTTSHELPARFDGDEEGAEAYERAVFGERRRATSPIAWDGVLIDDTREDAAEAGLLRRIDEALDALLGSRRSTWEADLLAAVGAPSLITYFREPARFFDSHLSQYTKSRRQAPIYWPVSTPSGGVTFWIYAPRFDERTLPRIINDLDAQLRRYDDRVEAAKASGGRVDPELVADLRERRALRDTLTERVREGYSPSPDDGFVVTLAPLASTFRHPGWRKRLDETWVELQRGDYDWAHLPMALWRDRVTAKCRTDASLAIAHGLPVPAPAGGSKAARKPKRAAASKRPVGDEQFSLGLDEEDAP